MRLIFRRVSSHAAVLLLMSTVARADVLGSADSPLIQRYAGSEIVHFERRLDVPFRLLTRPLEDPAAGSSEPEETYTTVTGEVRRITYASPEGARLKDVYRYYESTLQAAGFEPLYNCAGESCSPNSAGLDFNAALTPADAQAEMQGKARGQRYLAVKRSGGGNVYASVYCVRRNPLGADDGERVYTNLVIVETQ